jgi:hypothetical protein
MYTSEPRAQTCPRASRGRRAFVTLSVFLFLVPIPAPAIAQNVGIGGRVTDTTGAVLPGVTVEASSPALIEQVRSVITDSAGLYTITDLRPGTYTVTFRLSGFATVVREGVVLTGSFTATVNAELRVGALEEIITVTGEAPAVDIRNVVQQEVLNSEVRDRLPTGRNQLQMSELIPGVTISVGHDVGGTNEARGASQIHGSRAGDYSMQFDGAPMTIAGSGSQGLRNADPLEIREFVYELSGISAETESGGVRTNLVPMEGGNSFSGAFFTSYSNDRLQSDNFNQALRDLGIQRPTEIRQLHDLNGAFGGPLRRDRLWFWSSARTWGIEEVITGMFHAIDPVSFVFNPRLGQAGNADLSRPAVLDTYHHAVSTRVTFQATPRNKIALYGSYQPRGQDGLGLASGTVAYEGAQTSSITNERFLQVKWTSPITSRLLIEAVWTEGYNRSDLYATRSGLADSDIVAVRDVGTGFSYRASATGYSAFIGYQPSAKAALSYVTGSHAAKFGVDVNWGYQSWYNRRLNQNMLFVFSNGVPVSITVENGPWTSKQDFHKTALFAQDQWTIKRLTINAGLRYDQHIGTVSGKQRTGPNQFATFQQWPEIDDVPSWRDISPRLGLAYDLFGGARTALKASVNRYVVKEGTEFAQAQNPLLFNLSANRSWTDANRDFIPQEGELGPLSNRNFATTAPTTVATDDALREGWGVRAYNWEFAGGVQHQLTQDLSVNVQYTRRSYDNFTVTDNLLLTPADYDEYCITAPTDAGLGSVSGSRICGLYDLNPAKLGLVQNLRTSSERFGTQKEIWQGIDATMDLRMDRITLSGGLSSGTQGNMRDACFVIDSPEALRFCDVRPPWQNSIKFLGAVVLPWNFDAAATFQLIPGPEILADFTVRNAQVGSTVQFVNPARTTFSVGSATVPLLQPATVFNDPLYQVDVRVARAFRYQRLRARATLDIANLLNANTTLRQINTYGSNWLRPSQVLLPRIFKIGILVDF